jgi:hypothetical protein
VGAAPAELVPTLRICDCPFGPCLPELRSPPDPVLHGPTACHLFQYIDNNHCTTFPGGKWLSSFVSRVLVGVLGCISRRGVFNQKTNAIENFSCSNLVSTFDGGSPGYEDHLMKWMIIFFPLTLKLFFR